MDEFLSKRDLSDYMFEYKNLKRKDKVQKEKDEGRLKKFYERNTERLTEIKKAEEEEDFYRPYYPGIKLDQMETDESYEKNKNNPEFYPKLDSSEVPKNAVLINFGHPVGGTSSKMVSNSTINALNKERSMLENHVKKMRPAGAYGDDWGDEEDDPPGGVLIFRKEKKKKKKGGKK